MDYRKTYGLPERYFLSLGRMVEKKNLSTLVEAYVRFARVSVEKHGAGRMESGVRSSFAQNDYGVTRGEAAGGEDPHAGGQAAAAIKAENCKLKTEHCPPGLVFVGSGELEGALKEQARVLGLTVIDRTKWKAGESSEASHSLPAISHKENCGTVFFYGFRQIEENPVFYSLAEAFVLPSLKEEWGLVVNEAMACSLPVIVSRTAGCAEDLLPGSESWQCSVGSIRSGENADAGDCKLETENSLERRSNGFVFDPKSSDALSEALRRIADPLNPQRSTLNAAAMGRRSREIVERFSCENFARQALRAAEAASA